MSKKRFIQAIVIRSLPPLTKLAECIAYAEQTWDKLTQLGYGAETANQPRESKDWVAALTGVQAASFQTFWEAFAYKKGRNDAAMRWYQLGELSPHEYQVIIDAANKEALRALQPGQVRKMAQGWLFERRWLDHAMKPVVNKQSKIVALNQLNSEIMAMQKLYNYNQEPALLEQIDRLRVQFEDIKGKFAEVDQ